FDTGADRILGAEAAEIGADTSLHHSYTLGIGLAGRHAEIGPYLRQVLLGNTEQIDALAAGDLHHPDVILLRDIGDAPQLGGRGHPAANSRHHRKRAVALDVGVDAIVDEARR